MAQIKKYSTKAEMHWFLAELLCWIPASVEVGHNGVYIYTRLIKWKMFLFVFIVEVLSFTFTFTACLSRLRHCPAACSWYSLGCFQTVFYWNCAEVLHKAQVAFSNSFHSFSVCLESPITNDLKVCHSKHSRWIQWWRRFILSSKTRSSYNVNVKEEWAQFDHQHQFIVLTTPSLLLISVWLAKKRLWIHI